MNLINQSEFARILTSLTQLLADNGFDGQAGVVSDILWSLTYDSKEEFVGRLNSVDMWGGAGAVWEVSGFRTRNEEIEFWKLLIKLTEEMKEAGMINNRAFSTIDILRNELKKGR